MKSSRPLTLGLVSILGLVACQAPPPPATTDAGPRTVSQYSIEDFLDTTSYGGGFFSPDNSKILVHSDATGVYNAYALPTAGGEPVPLTASTGDSVFVLGYFPADERILYASDQGGNELDHVYVRELDGSVVDLTPGEKVKAQFVGWARDGKSFFVATNEREPQFFDVYEIATDGYARSLVFQNDEGHVVADVSFDGAHLALAKIHTRNDSDTYLYDRATKEVRHLTPHEGEVNFLAEAFAPDGKSLFLTTDDGSEFRYLVRQDLATGERQVVVRPDWDVTAASFSWRGRYLLVAVNHDARAELHVYDGTTLEPTALLPELPEADITAAQLSHDESHLSFWASSGRRPSDLFVKELAAEPRQLTRSLSPKIDPLDLVEGEVVRFASFDGLAVPGILYKPHSAGPESQVPALVWVHGGPGGQSTMGYNALAQYLVNHGYGVFAINNRGSGGYGKTFEALDNRAHGEGDLDDCVAARGMLAKTGWVDPQRVGILGGSYGGYMVLAALAFRPDAFDVGVDLFGVANWLRTLQSIPPWWAPIRKSLEVEMGAFEDEEYLRKISPLFHAANIKKPLIVLQGANDPRVLQVESDEMVEAVKANGVPVEYLVFPDEGHGFVKKENRIRGFEAILEFLDHHLKGVPSQPPVG